MNRTRVYYVCVNGKTRGKLYQRLDWAVRMAKRTKVAYPEHTVVVREYVLTFVDDIPVAPI